MYSNSWATPLSVVMCSAVSGLGLGSFYVSCYVVMLLVTCLLVTLVSVTYGLAVSGPLAADPMPAATHHRCLGDHPHPTHIIL
jgi:hypothetical protein